MKHTLREWKVEDVKSLVKHANNWAIAKNLTDKFPYPYTENDGLNFIKYASEEKSNVIFAIDINGKACGGIGLHPQTDIHKKNAELGYWLGEPFWGNGIITSAIKEVIKFGFNNLEIDRIFARPFGSNIASQRVLEKSGFKLEGKFEKTVWKTDKYEDELIYAIRKNK
ncbi:MAG: N-acetyltransferase [Bacteroidetes bacterium]|nr:MAG: N-acetyltransferase [Bacteroidota bacterium]